MLDSDMGDGDSTPLILPHPNSQSSSSGRHHQSHQQYPSSRRVPTMATSSATTAAAAPTAAAPADERTSSASTTTVLFSDANGKPLFPTLHKLRVEGQQLMRESSQQVAATLQEQDDKWKVSEQVSLTLSKSQATLSKSHATLQSKVRTLQTAAQIQQQLRQTVLTKYGAGRVVSYNEATATFSVQLSFGTLYTAQLPKSTGRLKTTKTRRRRKHTTTKAAPTNLELNSAYESWEKTRRGQVQAECRRVGLRFTEETMQQCLNCLVHHHVESQKAAQAARDAPPVPSAAPTLAGADGKPLFPFFYKMRQTGQDKLREANQQYRQHRTQTQKCTPCLLCAATVCATHSSAAFRQQVGITVCGTCVEHLEFDYFMDNTTDAEGSTRLRLRPEQLQKETQHLQDLYRRTHLLLAYSAQFMLGTANALEQNKKSHHKIGVGGSSAGLVSGVLGVAAACSILTPAGPPLLIASLVFGGSATAVQTGSEAINYYSEPNQFANRILTLQAISEQILQTVRQMRETTLLPYLDKAILKLEKGLGSSSEDTICGNGNLSKDGNAAAVVVSTTTATRAGARMGSSAATATSAAASVAMQEAALTGRFVSRATTAAARTARFARFAGGALSAATLVMEAHELRHTVDQIHKGSPCEKAQALRTIYANYQNHKMMPSTKYVEKMCQSYAKVRSKELFVQAMSSSLSSNVSSSENEQVGAAAVVDFDGRNDEEEDDLLLAEEVVSNLESAQREDDDDDSSVSSSSGSELSSSTITMSSSLQQSLSSSSAAAARPPSFSSLSSKASLLERVKRFKARESMRAQQAELALTE